MLFKHKEVYFLGKFKGHDEITQQLFIKLFRMIFRRALKKNEKDIVRKVIGEREKRFDPVVKIMKIV